MSDSKYTFQTDPSCGTYDDWVKKNGDELIETIYRSMHEAMQNDITRCMGTPAHLIDSK